MPHSHLVFVSVSITGRAKHNTHTEHFFTVGCKQRAEYYLVLCVVERQQVQLPEAAPLEAMINNKDPK